MMRERPAFGSVIARAPSPALRPTVRPSRGHVPSRLVFATDLGYA